MHERPLRSHWPQLDGFLSIESSHPNQSHGCHYYWLHANCTKLH
ncbi:hypothetical protein SLEP1_g54648 [Rubroshorea leprosula]|uniref:Uncharacterized protein n=1 Tax=Rubroshorea leprosula TaxID=152421 RepID=A0AAV5MFL2_9ROSI|nr:hypothetical protein SLEP1_g54648 [Rubroshorea leprosula]